MEQLPQIKQRRGIAEMLLSPQSSRLSYGSKNTSFNQERGVSQFDTRSAQKYFTIENGQTDGTQTAQNEFSTDIIISQPQNGQRRLLGIPSAQVILDNNEDDKNLIVDKQMAFHFKKRHLSVVPSMARFSKKKSPSASMDILEKQKLDQMIKVFGNRSQSYVRGKKLTLIDQANLNSQSRILQMLTDPSNSQLYTEQSHAALTSVRKLKKKKKQTIDFDAPQIDPKKIVLEMDLIDKSKIDQLKQKDDTSMLNLKNQKFDTMDIEDQIEFVRRQLVLTELGIEIPRNKETGEIDKQALFEIEINQKQPDKDSNQGSVFSPLKSERKTSSIISQIQPLFPLKTNINFREDLHLEPESKFEKRVLKMLEQKEPLTNFADQQKQAIQLQLKVGIFGERMAKVNKLVDLRFSSASEAFLNDNNLYKSFKAQIKEETTVQGKPLFPPRDEFQDRWKTMKGKVKTHQGVELSLSGHLMEADYRKRQEQIEKFESEKKLDQFMKQKIVKRNSGINHDELLIVDESADSKIQSKQFSTSNLNVGLEIVQEEDRRDNLPDTPQNQQKAIKPINLQSSRKLLEIKTKTDAFDTNSMVSLMTPAANFKRPNNDSTLKSGSSAMGSMLSQHQIYFSKEHSDPEVREIAFLVENELFFTIKSDKNLAQYNISLTNYTRQMFDKYHNSKGGKIMAKMQSKIMKDLIQQIEQNVEVKRIEHAMQKEQEDFHKEKTQRINKQLQEKLKNFIENRQQENDIINYVMEQEADESDEEFNVFDQLSKGYGQEKTKNVLNQKFNQRVENVKEKIQKVTEEKKKEYLISQKIFEQDKSNKDEMKKRMKFVPSPRNASQNKQMQFTQKLGSNYFDENLKVNKAPEKNPIQMAIQSQITQMTENIVLASKDHQKALKEYLKLCQQYIVAPLPILNKLDIDREHDQVTLGLEDYTINAGQVKSIAQVIKMFGANAFSKLYLNNNGLNDDLLSILLEGVYQNKNITHIEILFNQLQNLSVNQLCKFFQDQKHITSLKLAGTKTSISQTESLLHELQYYRYLYELQLKNFKFSTESSLYLAETILKNQNLTNLDLSWNQIQQKDFVKLLESLQDNKNLMHVNFSNISCVGKYISDIAELLYLFIRKNKSLLHIDLSNMGFGTEELVRIAEACTKSRTLVAIHLSGNQLDTQLLTKAQYEEIYDDIHRTDIPEDKKPSYEELNEKIILKQKDFNEQIRKVLRPRKRIRQFQGNYAQEYENEKKVNNQATRSSLIEKQPMSPRERNKGIRIKNEANELQKLIQEDQFVYTRFLGHYEMPHSHRWQESSSCWYCEKHQYTVFITSKSICEKFFVKPKDTRQFNEQKYYKEKIEEAQKRYEEEFQKDEINFIGSDCDERYYDNAVEEAKRIEIVKAKRSELEKQYKRRLSNVQEVPEEFFNQELKHLGLNPSVQIDKSKSDEFYRNLKIAGEFTNWKLHSLIPLHTFIKKLSQNAENQLRVVSLSKNNYEQELKEIQDGKPLRLQKIVDNRRDRMRKNLKKVKFSKSDKWVDNINEGDEQIQTPGWLDNLVRMLPYRDYVNFVIDPEILEKMEVTDQYLYECKEKVYAFACFLPPGEHNGCVLYNTDEKQELQEKKQIYSFLVKASQRKHPIDIRFKKVRQYKIERKFAQNQSMFREWKQPDYEKLLRKDMEITKIKRLSKDDERYEKIFGHFYDNIQLLLDYFQYMIGHSEYSVISWMDLSNFCQQLNLIDDKTKSLQLKDLDLIITAIVGTSAKQLNRSAFFEFLVRIAQTKFLERGNCQSIDEAVETLIDKHFKPVSQGGSQDKPIEMQGGLQFRIDNCWQLDQDDLIRANQQTIEKLYKHFLDGIDPLTSKPYVVLTLPQCIKIGPHIELSDLQISEAYSFCKMQYVDEVANNGEYKKLKMVEFYDFIVRLAYTKFKENKGMPFSDKMEKILDLLFQIIGAKRVSQKFEIEVSSESDYLSDE